MKTTSLNYQELASQIKAWGQALGLQQVGITDIDLTHYEKNFLAWLEKSFHGDMQYMQTHGSKRYKPNELHEGTIRVITARIDYLPADTEIFAILQNSKKAYISRYALGRDYHKVLKKRLNILADKISKVCVSHGYRIFTDSAPVLEKPLAEKAGLGWIGKNTNLINRHAGSWFFLGEIFTNIPLPCDTPTTNHCGSCRACLDVCPTQAIIAPYQLDARRCISYLTIELRGSIPKDLRPLLGNRIYGCDDCQLVCPWNKFAKFTNENDFKPRHNLASADLIELFAWNESEFLQRTEGSAIRRIGYECWLRNIAVALGNALYQQRDEKIILALQAKLNYPSDLVREHVVWALEQAKC